MRETDLYEPVKHYLENHGYLVRGEVLGCDLTASKGDDEVIVVELKRSANMQLLVQATDRQRITDAVYVAVPAPSKRNPHWRGTLRVLRMLELGLLTVHFGPTGPRVELVFDPMPYQRQKRSARRRAVIHEIAERSGDFNVGGSTRTPLVTGYRENAIFIACCLQLHGPSSPRALRARGTSAKTTAILSANHYGWFKRIERGVYALTDQGAADLDTYPELRDKSLAVLAEETP